MILFARALHVKSLPGRVVFGLGKWPPRLARTILVAAQLGLAGCSAPMDSGDMASGGADVAACAAHESALQSGTLQAHFSLTPYKESCETAPLVFDGVVSNEDGAVHIRPFSREVGACVTDDYTLDVHTPIDLDGRLAPIPDGAFVHVVYAPSQVYESGILVSNLDSFDGAPNPVTPGVGPWLSIDYTNGDASPTGADDFLLTTPFQCSDPNNSDGNARYAFKVVARATGESAMAKSGTWKSLIIESGPGAGTYAVVDAGIGDNEGVVRWSNFSLFRLASP